MKIIAIVPQLSQPRCVKRINSLIDNGFEVVAFGFDNGLYSENIGNIKCKVYNYQLPSNSSKFNSIILKFKLLNEVRRFSSKGDLVYVFGIELAFYYKLLLNRCRFIYEQADLNYTKLKFKGLVSFFKWIDKKLIKSSFLTVLTSQGFVEYLYPNVNTPLNVCIMPNRLHHSLKNCNKKDKVIFDINHLKFGFVGLIRYPRTIITFAEEIGRHFPQHEFHFYGEGYSSEKAKQICNLYENVYFHGGYKNPIDLPNIYSHIDLNVVCYDPLSENVKIAEPNKLYESIFFKVPIIVSKGTFLEQKVKKWDVGFSINAFNACEVNEFINNLKIDDLNNSILHASEISDEELFDDESKLIYTINRKLLS